MINYNQWLSQDIRLRTDHRVANEARAARLWAGLAPFRRAITVASDGLQRCWYAIESYRRRQATRRELARLNDHLLADIGIERKDIARFSLDAATARPRKAAPERGKIDIETSGKVIILRPPRRRPHGEGDSIPICSSRPAA